MPNSASVPIAHFSVPSGDGQRIAVHVAGVARDGMVLVIHGGPGGRSRIDPSLFDLERLRVVWMDQRGCGDSRPRASLRRNATPALIGDIERVRRWLGVERCMVLGGSWGAALALAWAGAHPGHVDAVVLRGAYLAGRRETQRFFLRGRRRAPREWSALMRAAGAEAASQLSQCCSHLSQFGTPTRRRALGISWGRYEAAMLGLGRRNPPRVSPRAADAMAGAYRIQGRYLARGCWLSGDRLRRAVKPLRGIDAPLLAVHGRRDLACPPANLERLRAWLPRLEARLIDAGHRQDEPAMAGALREVVRELLRGLPAAR